jgi:hypothetical protein
VLINMAFCSQPPFLQTHPRKKHVFKNTNVGGICGYEFYPASIPIIIKWLVLYYW